MPCENTQYRRSGLYGLPNEFARAQQQFIGNAAYLRPIPEQNLEGNLETFGPVATQLLREYLDDENRQLSRADRLMRMRRAIQIGDSSYLPPTSVYEGFGYWNKDDNVTFGADACEFLLHEPTMFDPDDSDVDFDVEDQMMNSDFIQSIVRGVGL